MGIYKVVIFIVYVNVVCIIIVSEAKADRRVVFD